MLTAPIAAARERIAIAATADSILLALAAGQDQVRAENLTDDNAPAVWSALAARLKGYRGGAYARRADAGLLDLHARLERLLAGVRAAGERGDLGDAIDRYRQIRNAQHALTVAAAGRQGEVELSEVPMRIYVGQLLRIAGTIANIDEVWPDWRNQLRGGRYVMPPWETTGNQPFDIAATATNLRWLASDTVRAWVPTLAQAVRAVAEQTNAEEARHVGATGVHVGASEPRPVHHRISDL
ncbi:hypothetical protein [Actinoplanes teichomyceticus]|uniref:Uncharacterized protein n=1 Tax=Actinoplanes teichomyceticus TaxID=1867 RepID=A0A561WI84_ACTTI|nr:hypothetical protein [Actinoplanes teichomyceticus]TWG23589.1 hypothetical protein FHX34_102138 [Actinoplanes teichomyceticus]GIF16216.1 hypothetical protein Ate01nite_62480 [Actinoplanes teichomyceticus]